MVMMSKRWNTRFLSFYDEDVLCGFIYYVVQFKQVFVMFFAVDQSWRFQGYGSKILNKFMRCIQIRKLSFQLNMPVGKIKQTR